MKPIRSILGFTAAMALLVTVGCSKQETPVTPTSGNETKSPAPAASETPQPAQPAAASEAPPTAPATPAPAVAAETPVAIPAPPPVVAPAVPAPAETPAAIQPQKLAAQPDSQQLQAFAAKLTNQVSAALGATNQVASMTTTQVQALLDQAKALTANQKYQEALTTLNQLYATKLTDAQKQQVDALKAQIQTAMTEKASSALGGFLGGKK